MNQHYNIELLYFDFAVKYCPAICGEMTTSVMATGVWRCTQLDFTSSDENVLEEMSLEEISFQPENHDFLVAEISKGIIIEKSWNRFWN